MSEEIRNDIFALAARAKLSDNTDERETGERVMDYLRNQDA